MSIPLVVPEPSLARVLIVDDTAANLRLMHVMLRGLELEIMAVSSGPEAVDCVRAGEYAVILMDVRMPDMDGYETATRIRALEKDHLRLTPILFVTAEYQAEVQVRKGYSVGAVDYLLKPIVREILVAKVMFFVDLFKTRRQLEARMLYQQELQQILRELGFARDIQRSILPVSLDHPGVAMYATLETAQQVGGDFYDVSSCHIGADRRLCAVVGDVMGKGTPAALVMVLALTVLREATRLSGSPRDVLMRANAMLFDRFQSMQTSNAVTVACISLDVQSRTLFYSLAGHEDVLVWSRRSGDVTLLRSTGYTLGMFDDGRYEELARQLEAGDKILLYTDGITEARNAERQFFTQEQLCDLVQRHAHEAVDTLGKRILEAVREFQGPVLRDDIALLIIEIL